MRRSVTKEVKSDPTACEDFFIVVCEAHVLQLVMEKFNITGLDDQPANDDDKFGSQFKGLSKDERSKFFIQAISEIISHFTHGFEVEVAERKLTQSDRVLSYAKDLMTLGLLYLEFCDGIREGDGTRILRCWRFLLLVFKAKNKRKYAIQAATLLMQRHFLFTDRMKHQLLWSRTVNVHGRIGRNVPMDLHMEHLNRELKCAMRHLGSNVSASSISRIGYSLRKLIDIKENYDKQTGIPVESGFHTTRSLLKDINLAIEELRKANVFAEIPQRKHKHFKSFKHNVAASLKNSDLKSWLDDLLSRLIR